MMKKAASYIVIVTVALLLTACQGGGNNGNTGETGFIGGDKGIQLRFSNNAPPSPIADNGQQTFPVIVEAVNQGEQEVSSSDAMVTLEGFSYSAFNKSKDSLEKNPPENITANRKTPAGDIIEAPPVFTEFPNFTYVEDVQAGYETAMIAKMCYEYGSTTSSSLCVRDDMLLAEGDSPCAVSATRQSSSSGAPVKITNVDQEVSASDRTSLLFTVKNVGTGDVYETGTTCDPGQGTRVEGDVVVEFSGLDGVTEMDCRGQQRLGDRRFRLRFSQSDLRSSAGETFSCDLIIPSENRNNRQEPFTAELDYLYETRTSKTLTVRNTVE